ncbi:glycosyltransferase [Arcicella rosea]|uniref:Glycosyltransferase involved in cell wall biosynthesis n=1 Tax=Arcicella rosea TaxID=502909 RepID=A0A841EFP5_9BACT|nr:glycosyltransferase [Arcicella rosea]MBB6001965.1 glycosyltransferase involved in cell wall biosynthesis [Arcicella rosea]
MNLCFAYPNKFRFSETFIRDQIEQLQPTITIYEGWYPSLNQVDKSFLPFPFNYLLIRGGLRRLFPKVYHKIYTFFLSNYLIENNIDVVLAQYGPMGAILVDACNKANVGLVVHFHGFDANEKVTLSKFLPLYKKMFKSVKGIIAVSKDMREKLIGFGANPDTTIFNSCFVDTNKFTLGKPEENDNVFITVGRFTEKKSPFSTIRAFKKVTESISDVKMIMIGEGELLSEAKTLAKELEVDSLIDFRGAKLPHEIAESLKSARVFLQHSMIASNGDSEGTPVSVLEASATGLPIVSTRHAGIKDAVVHGETGFLVEEGDWASMAEYMIKLIEDPALAGRMGRAARKHIEENYEMSKRVQTLREILEK